MQSFVGQQTHNAPPNLFSLLFIVIVKLNYEDGFMKPAPIGKEHNVLRGWNRRIVLVWRREEIIAKADALASVNRERFSDTQSNRHAVAHH